MVDPDANPEPSAGDDEPSATVHELGRIVETGAQRIRRLQTEAHTLAREQVEALARDLTALAQRAGEVADGGEAYPVGVRELCSRLVDELSQQSQSMVAIMERAPKA